MFCHLVALALWFGIQPPIEGLGIQAGTKIVQADCARGMITLSGPVKSTGPQK